MLSCMTFVFCSLLELAWVGYLSREEVDPPKSVTINTAKVSPCVHQYSDGVKPKTSSTPLHNRYETNSIVPRFDMNS
ncbi:unnamed protein product [Gongylonema pulchrum]|uniref:Secreted protein n=1 Tax=Gongylonema pulchrum TaxID=637853 RepID=A0A183DJN4_9BILA|nr:unnamed protein product [Gongylonema pulchrum]